MLAVLPKSQIYTDCVRVFFTRLLQLELSSVEAVQTRHFNIFQVKIIERAEQNHYEN